MHPKRSLLWSLGLAVVLVLGSCPAKAADPFRSGSAARPLGPALQAAFESFFRDGDYESAAQKLNKAQQQNPGEPLVYTLQAALAYQNGQLDRVTALVQKTRQAAQGMSETDPSRSHLYLGLAQGLEASSYYLKDGILGLPKVLTYVPSMFLEFKAAKDLAPDDPEINLFVGYIDVLLTKHDEALKEFRKSTPAYLAFRGQALAYRDKKAYDDAQAMAEKALAAAPRNPDLFYLRGQILALQGKPAQAIEAFDRAIELGTQLPESIKKQLRRERDAQAQQLATKS